MEIAEVITAYKEKRPVILKDNILSERQKLFGPNLKIPDRGLEKNIGKSFEIDQIENKNKKNPFVRLKGMDVHHENGQPMNSIELIIPITAIELAK